jgi:uncharacterized membrane protein
MKRMIIWIWSRGVVSTFLTGFFTVLPFVITLVIMGWVGRKLQQLVGPGSFAGRALRDIGMRFVMDDTIATFIGWALVLIVLWFVGAVMKSTAKYKLEKMLDRIINRIPIVSSIFGPVSQVVDMLRQDDKSRVQSMQVVYCTFGQEYGGGCLGLRASEMTYQFGSRACYVIYIPTAPVPMSGGIIFAPVEDVYPVDMDVEALLQMCVSLGMMASKVVPGKYTSGAQAAARPSARSSSGLDR